MKILIVFNHPAPYKVDLFNELSKRFDVDVIFERNKARNRPESFYKCNQYEFNHLKNGGIHINIGKENCYGSFVRNYIENHHKKYDLIIMNGYSTFAEMKAIKYMINANIPYILMINGGIINKNEFTFKRKLKTYYISNARYFLSPGTISDEYLIYYGANKQRIFHYPYGTIHEKDILVKPISKTEKEYIRDDYFLPQETMYVCPNQFIKRKNNLSLIKQFKNKKCYLLLIGNGPLKNKYLKYIKKHNMNNVIVWDFLPKQKLFEIMRSADGLISLSKYDIYGHTIIEGMACGLTVFASKNIVSAQEIIKNGINGYILKKDKELFKIIKSESKISRSKIIHTAQQYKIENSAKELEKILAKKCL